MILLLRSVALAALAASVSAQDPAATAGSLAGLEGVTADEPVSAGVRGFPRVLSRGFDEARSLLPENLHRPIDDAIETMRRDSGFAVDDPDAWLEQGLDPDAAVTVSFAVPGGFLGFPQRMTLRLPVVDADLASRLVASRSGAMEVLEGGGMVADSVAFRAIGTDLLVVAHGGISDPAEMADELRSQVEAFAAGPKVSALPVHRAVAARLAGEATAAALLRPDRWRVGDLDRELRVVDSLLVAMDAGGFVGGLRLRPDPERARLLVRGGDPREPLRALPLPAATLAFSVADPVALFDSLAAAELPILGFRIDAADIFEPLATVLDGSSFGAVAYPNPTGVAPRWVVFVGTTDQTAAIAAVEELFEQASATLRRVEAPDAARLWHDPNEGVWMGVRDGAIYIGDAEDEITSTVRGASPGHEPTIPEDALAAVEVSLEGLPGMFGAVIPPELTRGGLAGRLDLDGEVLVATLKRSGADDGPSLVGQIIAWSAIASAFDEALAPDRREQKQAEDATASIYQTAVIYATRNTRVPTMEELITPDQTGRPYLEPPASIDPWGHPYRIRRLEGRLRFEVLSFGPDGVEGGGDDVVYPPR